MFGYKIKVPLRCSIMFYCILTIGNSNFVSRHFWNWEEMLRVLKGFTCFADPHGSRLWCFFIFPSWRMSVIRSYWSYREKNVINLREEHLQLGLRCNLGVFYGKLCNLVLVRFYTLQLRTDCRERLSCMKFPNKFFLLLFFNWNFSEFAQI